MNKQTRAAKIRANSFDEESNTIDIVWTTGAAVRRIDWDGTEYDEVLSLEPGAVRLDRLNSGAPLLDSHQDGGIANVIGAIVEKSARIESGKGIATVRLSSATSDADVVQKIREGVIRNISVGYWTHAQTRSDDNPPVVTVTDWEPLEISAVPIPADAGAQIRSASGRPTKRLSRAAAAAAYAARLLHQTTQSSEQARGAVEARKLLAGSTAALDKLEIESGARAARRLLRRKA